ncbi:MAG: hypothetical protein FJX34_01835 [Alphaproteobacteria bacterium]|nr:hypothetical protein [Alphaproteobacteria bacterium]
MTMTSLGNILRNKREEAKLEIVDVAMQLRVKPEELLAIENDEIEKLANHLYAPGLVRSYARFVGVEKGIIDKGLSELKLRSNTEQKKHRLVNLNKEEHLAPNKNLVVNSLLVTSFLLLVLLPLYIFLDDKSDLLVTKDIIYQLSEINGGK